jgi:cytochrome b pre-mRNA-processing protein 3
MSLDYGLITSDAELAAAIWRNFLGARGAMGIDGRGQAVNVAGLKLAPIQDKELIRDPNADDKSGVSDFEGELRGKYVEFPHLMWVVVLYVRQEVERLAALPDEEIFKHMNIGKFEPVSSHYGG